ncbi:MAG TPA: hypothetical protein VF407_03770 [Polyangiaceae bacterium]
MWRAGWAALLVITGCGTGGASSEPPSPGCVVTVCDLTGGRIECTTRCDRTVVCGSSPTASVDVASVCADHW